MAPFKAICSHGHVFIKFAKVIYLPRKTVSFHYDFPFLYAVDLEMAMAFLKSDEGRVELDRVWF